MSKDTPTEPNPLKLRPKKLTPEEQHRRYWEAARAREYEVRGCGRLVLTIPLFVGVFFGFAYSGAIIGDLGFHHIDEYAGFLGFGVGAFIGLLAAIAAVGWLWRY